MQVLVALAPGRRRGRRPRRPDPDLLGRTGGQRDAINCVIARLRRLAEAVRRRGLRGRSDQRSDTASIRAAPPAAPFRVAVRRLAGATLPPVRRAGRRSARRRQRLALARFWGRRRIVWIAAPEAPRRRPRRLPARPRGDARAAAPTRPPMRRLCAIGGGGRAGLRARLVGARHGLSGWRAWSSTPGRRAGRRHPPCRRRLAAGPELDPADPEGRVVKALMSEVGDDLVAIEKVQLDALAAAPASAGILIAAPPSQRHRQFQEAVVVMAPARGGRSPRRPAPAVRPHADGRRTDRGGRRRARRGRPAVAAQCPGLLHALLGGSWKAAGRARPSPSSRTALWPPACRLRISKSTAASPSPFCVARSGRHRRRSRRRRQTGDRYGYGYAQNAMLVQAALGDVDAAFRTASAIYLQEGAEIAPTMFSVTQGQYAGGRRAPRAFLGSARSLR